MAIGGRKKEGRPLPEKPEDKIWREEFDQMTVEDHNEKLKGLGLEEEDIEEFDEVFYGEADEKAKPKKDLKS
ncbi:MAG: hypothetical protein ABID38_02615 [Candidatus Diapherotrites archaeon]